MTFTTSVFVPYARPHRRLKHHYSSDKNTAT